MDSQVGSRGKDRVLGVQGYRVPLILWFFRSSGEVH